MLAERDEKRGTLFFGRTFFSFLEIFLSFFIKFGENGKNFNDKILKESFEKKINKNFLHPNPRKKDKRKNMMI